MAHERKRHIYDIIQKRAKLWPVVGIIGPRQCGKSTLLRHQLKNGTYITLDSPSTRRSAERSPELFIREALAESLKITIDEIQKAPDLFDTIKLLADENRRPGTFFISGSTQFSAKVGIRESLTGRIGLQRLYPLTAAELNSTSFCKPLVDLAYGKSVKASNLSASEVLKCARLGGMPGHCFLRNERERQEYLRGWLETTCYRDAIQILKSKPDPGLLERIFRCLATHPFIDVAELAAEIDEHARRVRSHVEILEELFVVSRIEPSGLGVGKPRFFVSDSGFSKTIGTGDLDAMRVWFANELYAQFEYSGENKLRLQYFRSKNKSGIDFVLPDYKIAFLITDEELCHEYTLRAPISFAKKHPDWRVVIASPASSPQIVHDRVRLLPWSGLC